MNSLRKHPVLCSIILWACFMVTLIVVRIVFSPTLLVDIGAAGASVVASITGILATVCGFAAKWAGKE